MKTFLLIVCTTAIALSVASGTSAVTAIGNQTSTPQTATSPAGTLSDQDRAALVDQLAKTKQAFIDSIRGLSDAQWRFKPNPFKWSIAECADHIIMSEDFFMANEQKLLQTPAQSRPADQAASQDKAVQGFVANRTNKFFNPDALAPKGQFGTPAEAIAQFTSRRDHNIEYARTTKDDLRAHFVPTPRGTLDAYQLLLVMAGHSGRHTAQIQEVKASPKYPAS
jgi:hypothetical protein